MAAALARANALPIGIDPYWFEPSGVVDGVVAAAGRPGNVPIGAGARYWLGATAEGNALGVPSDALVGGVTRVVPPSDGIDSAAGG